MQQDTARQAKDALAQIDKLTALRDAIAAAIQSKPSMVSIGFDQGQNLTFPPDQFGPDQTAIILAQMRTYVQALLDDATAALDQIT